jgi:hypothetical protein
MRSSLFQILTELAITHPRLVLLRGREYYRIEDLLKWARRDLVSGHPDDQEALSSPIYWHTTDGKGKIVIRKNDYVVAFVEPGSDTQTDLE